MNCPTTLGKHCGNTKSAAYARTNDFSLAQISLQPHFSEQCSVTKMHDGEYMLRWSPLNAADPSVASGCGGAEGGTRTMARQHRRKTRVCVSIQATCSPWGLLFPHLLSFACIQNQLMWQTSDQLTGIRALMYTTPRPRWMLTQVVVHTRSRQSLANGVREVSHSNGKPSAVRSREG